MDVGKLMNSFRCQRCDNPSDFCKDCMAKVEATVESLKKALASLPCKYEGTYGNPTPEHYVFDICPPCWARKELGPTPAPKDNPWTPNKKL